ncbi:MAG: hypothetical protein HC827_12790 [Cyanobacteria bacterium RM1_2_2]|nr:hypothetical protein [Cyanobacteria bacterium RM1_2_2]
MVLKFLGKGKRSEYFLEAPPSTNGAEPPKTSEAKAADAPAPLEAVGEAVASAKELVSNGAAEVAEATKTKAKKFKKSKSAETKESASAAPSATVTAPIAPAPQPEPVNFATDHLMPANMPRRRPGPSLDTFRSMAKDVTPRK